VSSTLGCGVMLGVTDMMYMPLALCIDSQLMKPSRRFRLQHIDVKYLCTISCSWRKILL
jgi:hypothetical protein